MRRWAGGGADLVPLFAHLTKGYSPHQTKRLRRLPRHGTNPFPLFNRIEQRNAAVRLHAAMVAFHRWLVEWQGAHARGARTPLQEPHVVDLPRRKRPSRRSCPKRPRRLALHRNRPEPPEPPAAPGEPAAATAPRASESGRRLVLSPAGEAAPTGAGQDAGEPLLAPPPAPRTRTTCCRWAHLMQGLGPAAERELARGRGSTVGSLPRGPRPPRRGVTPAREQDFLRRIAQLGCVDGAPCRIAPVMLSELADLGSHFTPEQWARLTDALTEAVGNPLEVWRQSSARTPPRRRASARTRSCGATAIPPRRGATRSNGTAGSRA